jgi:hypothetical protein
LGSANFASSAETKQLSDRTVQYVQPINRYNHAGLIRG